MLPEPAPAGQAACIAFNISCLWLFAAPVSAKPSSRPLASRNRDAMPPGTGFDRQAPVVPAGGGHITAGMAGVFTTKGIAREHEDWRDLDSTVADGLEREPW